jgi:hypothetical protein
VRALDFTKALSILNSELARTLEAEVGTSSRQQWIHLATDFANMYVRIRIQLDSWTYSWTY